VRARSSVTRPPDLGTWLKSFQQFANLPVPSLVAGKGLAAAGVGNIGLALFDLSGFVIVTVGMFSLCVWLADTLYSAGWLRMQSGGTANRSKERSAKQAANSGLLGDAAPPLALALKDWRVIPRDLRNFAQFLTPLFLLPFFYFNLFGSRRGGLDVARRVNDLTNGTANVSNVLAAGGILFTAMLMFSRIAATGISMEGKSFWLIKTAPISGREVLAGKFISTMLPFAILSTLMLAGLAIWRGFTPLGFAYGWFGILLLGAGMLAIDTGMAARWANLNWDNPRQMSSGWGALIALVSSMMLSLTAGICLCLPLVTRVLLPHYEIVACIIGPILAIAITSGTAGFMIGIGLKRLPLVGEA
jgi:ABC-2 type transport system permease protein